MVQPGESVKLRDLLEKMSDYWDGKVDEWHRLIMDQSQRVEVAIKLWALVVLRVHAMAAALGPVQSAAEG